MKVKIKYPKLLLLLLIFILAFLFLANKSFGPAREAISSLGYGGAFLAGIFFTYGFTAAPATAALLIMAKQQNMILTGTIAGLGALVGDFIIFHLLRSTFSEEIDLLKKEKALCYIYNKLPSILKKYLLPVFAGLVIASPLPDELGVCLLAVSRISTKAFTILSYLLNTAGIFIILLIGKMIG